MSTGRRLRVGARGSELSRRQVERVLTLLAAQPGAPAAEFVTIQTRGDRMPSVPLAQIRGTGIFTSSLEKALLERRIDIAVHSLKDLAVDSPPGLMLAAVLEREDPRDFLISRDDGDLDRLAAGSRVGTGSLRRQAFLRHWRSDLELADVRGNVPTRLAKLRTGELDAVVLAAAGLRRLGIEPPPAGALEVERFPPAPGQGALAVQVREQDSPTRRWADALDDPVVRMEITAERELLRHLGGGCQLPVGALARAARSDQGARLDLLAVVASSDGAHWLSQRLAVDLPAPAADRPDLEVARELGRKLGRELLERGAGEILARCRATDPGGAPP